MLRIPADNCHEMEIVWLFRRLGGSLTSNLVLDPSIAPATGTSESGGWTTRQLKRYIKGLDNFNIVGADVVEVSPPYDSAAETTSVAAADLIVDLVAAMVQNTDFTGVSSREKTQVLGEDEL